MSKIKIFALGGLNENGKNMYVIEVNNDIFVFEAGLKYTNDSALGIDYIIPNFDYLKDNKERIKGIFLTHGHDENMGALPDILPELGNINVYGAKFTLDIIKKDLEDANVKHQALIEIKAHKSLNFGSTTIFPVSLSHSIPDNLGYAIYTEDGVIFFASDFVFDSLMRGSYQTDIGKLAYIGKQGVLCLMAESCYASRIGHTSPNHRIDLLIRETLNKAQSRIIFNILNTHIYRIQELFNEVSKTDRKIVIMGKKLQGVINDALENNYMTVSKDIIGDLSNINDENVVILVANEREKPYSSIIKIINGYDKFIKLNKLDTVFFCMPSIEGNEKNFYEIANDIAKIGCELVLLDSKKNSSHHASSEDLFEMIDLMKPKYYFPIKGEYRQQVANAELAEKLEINASNILLKLNGDVVTFEKGKLVENFERVTSGEVLIDGNSSDDIGELVLNDRELLKENGIVIVSTTINKQTKKIIVGPEITSRGFIYMKDNADLIKDMETICTKIITENIISNYIEYNKIKNSIREELSKFLYKETECNPVIINVLQEI